MALRDQHGVVVSRPAEVAHERAGRAEIAHVGIKPYVYRAGLRHAVVAEDFGDLLRPHERVAEENALPRNADRHLDALEL